MSLSRDVKLIFSATLRNGFRRKYKRVIGIIECRPVEISDYERCPFKQANKCSIIRRTMIIFCLWFIIGLQELTIKLPLRLFGILRNRLTSQHLAFRLSAGCIVPCVKKPFMREAGIKSRFEITRSSSSAWNLPFRYQFSLSYNAKKIIFLVEVLYFL